MDAGPRSGVPPQTRADAVQRLTLDCTDSDGPTSTCPVDLMADDTFTPRPLNLASERGKDHPALTGDPLSYTRSELIEAGYGLRPDPDKDRAAYARWLTAATLPGRLLEIKRASGNSHTVVKEDAGPWTGAVMTGTPDYISVE
jgi:hypothetical protein